MEQAKSNDDWVWYSGAVEGWLAAALAINYSRSEDEVIEKYKDAIYQYNRRKVLSLSGTLLSFYS